jgi:transcriptional regulator NrdR family protein
MRCAAPRNQQEEVPMPEANTHVGIACPECGGAALTIDSRPRPDGRSRRRKCINCDHRFNTFESITRFKRREADAKVDDHLADLRRGLEEALDILSETKLG